MSGESTWRKEEASGNMDHLEIEISKIKKLLCLVTIQVLWLPKIGLVFMIYENLNQEG